MDIEKLIELLSRYSEPVIAYKLDADFAAACMEAANELAKIPSFQAENEKLRAELEQVKRENDALWIYIEIVDREYQRYMDRGYIDRLDELKRTWRRGQKED